MKYDRVLVYTKQGNLLRYLYTGKVAHMYRNANQEGIKQYYEREREIQLIARIRWDANGNCFCSIKCPVNPLPVKGEFEIPTISALHSFLNANGWTFKQNMRASWFK